MSTIMMNRVLSSVLLLLACLPGKALSVDFTLVTRGPKTVVAGHYMFFAVTSNLLSGVDDQMVTPLIYDLPPAASARFITLELFCCGTKLWRLESDMAVRIQTDVSTPPGTYPISIYYITDTGVQRWTTYTITVLPPVPANSSSITFPPNTGLASLAAWERNMIAFGRQHCNVGEAVLEEGFPWYYDGQRVYLQISDYTHDAFWNSCADIQEGVYRPYVISNNGNIPGWRLFPHGLAMDYQRTGDVESMRALEMLRVGNTWAAASRMTYLIDSGLSREVAYGLNVNTVYEQLTGTRSASMQDLAEVAMGHFDQWFVSKSAPYVQPFMVGLSAEALIGYHGLTKDPRVLPLLRLAADALWQDSWDSTGQAFRYYNGDGTSYAAADVSLLIAPLYGWVYQQTGREIYRFMGDAIFTGGVQGAWLDGGKQFSQNYRWSFDYLKWRLAPSVNPAPKIGRRR